MGIGLGGNGMKISIETLKKIIAESKNDLTLDELLVRANCAEKGEEA